jgi:hypothetical protein
VHANRINNSCKRVILTLNAADRVTQIKYTKSDNTLIDQIDYTYDARWPAHQQNHAQWQ